MVTLSLALLTMVSTTTPGDLTYARNMAYARRNIAEAIASDPLLVKAIRTHNQSGETLDEIKAKDARWIKDTSYPLRAELTHNACAKRLTELTARDPKIVEAFLMNNQGALVCSTKVTSDYWQGDEAKWQQTFGASSDMFVDEPSFDASTEVYAAQFSVLIRADGTNIGALTLTLRFRGDEASAAAQPKAK